MDMKEKLELLMNDLVGNYEKKAELLQKVWEKQKDKDAADEILEVAKRSAHDAGLIDGTNADKRKAQLIEAVVEEQAQVNAMGTIVSTVRHELSLLEVRISSCRDQLRFFEILFTIND